jgi:hypothetical protein
MPNVITASIANAPTSLGALEKNMTAKHISPMKKKADSIIRKPARTQALAIENKRIVAADAATTKKNPTE